MKISIKDQAPGSNPNLGIILSYVGFQLIGCLKTANQSA